MYTPQAHECGPYMPLHSSLPLLRRDHSYFHTRFIQGPLHIWRSTHSLLSKFLFPFLSSSSFFFKEFSNKTLFLLHCSPPPEFFSVRKGDGPESPERDFTHISFTRIILLALCRVYTLIFILLVVKLEVCYYRFQVLS